MPSVMLTNVPGPQKPVSFLDQEVIEMRFHAVSSPFGLMYQIYSYNGKITATINGDPGIGDVDELARLWRSEFNALYEDVMRTDSRCLREHRVRLQLSFGSKFFAGAALFALGATFVAKLAGLSQSKK